MTRGKRWITKKSFELSILLAGCLLLAAAIVLGSTSEVLGDDTLVDPITRENVENESQGYSRFQHTNPNHSRMPCALCHKRDDDSPAPKFSGHVPCSGCHTQQFADTGSQICTICHANAQTAAMKRFPRLRNFNARFDHARHLRQTGCATCHKPSRRGVALSIPAGLPAHNTCFQCHGPQAESGGRNIGSCNTCHQLGRPTRTSESAPAFAKNFDHSEHRGVGRLNCRSCHTVRAGMPRGRQVSSPAASMHFASSSVQSCASCHNSKRTFGGADFASCKRCHQGASFKF